MATVKDIKVLLKQMNSLIDEVDELVLLHEEEKEQLNYPAEDIHSDYTVL